MSAHVIRHGMHPGRFWAAMLLAFIFTILPRSAMALDPGRTISQYKHTAWTLADGAPAKMTTTTRSTDGFLWIGAESGLYRFDGISFERILGSPSDHSRSQAVTALYSDRSGVIWVGYDYGGIAIYRNGRLASFNHDHTTGSVNGIEQTRDGAIWVSTTGLHPEMWRFFQGRWTYIDRSWGLPQGSIGEMYGDSAGSLWVISHGQLLSLAAGQNKFVTTGISTTICTVFSPDKDGRAWIFNSTTGFRLLGEIGNALHPQKPTVIFYKSLPACSGGLVDRDGGLWFIDGKTGLVHSSLARLATAHGDSAKAYDHFVAVDGLSSNAVNNLNEDAEGDIWATTINGLDRFRSADVVREAAVPINVGYTTVVADKYGTIFAESGAKLFEAKSTQPMHEIANLQFGDRMCARRDGGVWLVKRSGVMSFMNGVWSSDGPVPIAVDPKRPYGPCVEDGTGHLWIGVNFRGTFRRSSTGWEQVTIYPGKPGLWPFTVAPDGQGRVLMYVGPHGLLRTSGAQVAMLWDKSFDMVGMVKALYSGPNALYVGGELGFARMRNHKLAFLDGAVYPWLRSVTGVARSKGDLWMMGDAGVIRLPAPEFDAAFDHPGRPLHPRIYTTADGLSGSALQYGPQDVAIGADGRIWVATNEGISRIDPANLHNRPAGPGVAIRSVAIDGRSIGAQSQIVLPPGTSRLQIDYAALSISAPENIHFRYRLDPLDTDWIDAAGRRQAFYTTLAPGDYTFRVRAVNADNVSSPADAVVHVRVEPKFVQTLFFDFLCLVAILVAIFLIYQMRVRQIERQFSSRLQDRLEERNRIARELHDTFLQGFQGLVLKFQSVAVTIPEGQPTRQILDNALVRADLILVDGRERVQDLRQDIEFSTIDQQLKDTIGNAEFAPEVTVELAIRGNARPVRPVVREEIARFATEALRNVARHAHAAHVIITLSFGFWHLTLQIVDDGVGIDPAIMAAGGRTGHFGLVGMRERATRLRGAFSLRSAAATGTAVVLKIPGRIAYETGFARWFRGAPGLAVGDIKTGL